MKVDDAIKRVLDEGRVRARKDYFLASCFTTLHGKEAPKEWIVNFYNPEKKTILDFYVSDEVREESETPALKTMKPLELDKVKTELKDILDKVTISKGVMKVLVFLHKKHIWTVNIVGKDMQVDSIEFDAESGTMLKKKKMSLVSDRK